LNLFKPVQTVLSAAASSSPFAIAPFNPSSEAIALLRKQGLLAGARWIASPNFDARPNGAAIDLLVIHNISLPPRNFGGAGVVELFTNTLNPDEHLFYSTIADLRVSAHLFIRRNGSAIQFVGCGERAWHAGVSSWNGRERCNDFSIGIELEGTDEMPFTYAQYSKLIGVSHLLQRAYGIRHVAGHSDIAPGRKSDPGPYFDWRLFGASSGLERRE
jgi:AmpD protein